MKMKIETTSPCELLLTEVYSGLLLETGDGNKISVCMRDDTFEINVIPAGGDHCNWWRVNMQTGRIEKMGGVKADLDGSGFGSLETLPPTATEGETDVQG